MSRMAWPKSRALEFSNMPVNSMPEDAIANGPDASG